LKKTKKQKNKKTINKKQKTKKQKNKKTINKKQKTKKQKSFIKSLNLINFKIINFVNSYQYETNLLFKVLLFFNNHIN
ncbi:hypothetical protein BCR32DRAFT_305439, partial [Anaeromyces robustus]